MTHAPHHGRRPPDDRRRQIRRAARNGFLWFTGLWLLLRSPFHRVRDWTVKQIKRLASNRPVALGAVAGLGVMTAGLIAYAMLSDGGYHPTRLMPDLRPSASVTPSTPTPAPTPSPTSSPPPLTPTSPPPLTPEPSTTTPTPQPPQPPPVQLPHPPVVAVALPSPTTAPSPSPAPIPASTPTPTPTPTPALSPTQHCLRTPDGEGHCLNPNGLIQNSKTPPGWTH